MSQFYDQASLVVVPSGYKAGTVYAQKPLTTDGQLTFTRTGDTATRVASNGLIERVRTNVIPYSQAFDNALWIKDSNGTGVAPVVTANNATAPDGTMTADTIVFNAGAGTTTGDSSVVYQAITLTGSATASFYARVTSGTGQLVFRSVAGATYTTANLTTTWQRFSAAENGASGFFEIGIRRGLSNEPINASVTAQMWGAQLETGDIATDYIATTTAAVSVGPVANVPRLDYLGSTCPRLLLEPQRTNLRTFSEQFSSLSPSNVTITSNDTTSPDGYANADKLTPSGSGFHTIGDTISVTAGQKYTISIFYKYGTHKNIGFYDNNTAGSEITINMETNAFTLGANVDAGGVVPYGNGWYRAYATFTAGNANMVNYIIFRDNTNNGNYTADGSYSWFYGWQVELGAYATSYIGPTLGAAVTRGADACSKTGISSLIGQTEGTLFVDFTLNALADYGTPISVNDGSTLNYVWLTIFANGNLRGELYNGAAQASISYSGAVNGGRYKMAFGYKTNDFALYVNGALVGTDLTGTTFSGTTLSRVDTNLTNAAVYSTASESINQALVFKTRLTNAELAELTTL